MPIEWNYNVLLLEDIDLEPPGGFLWTVHPGNDLFTPSNTTAIGIPEFPKKIRI
jgi:hypothetical protein